MRALRCALVSLIAWASIAAGANAPATRPAIAPKLDLRIDRDGWGKADLRNVEAVLRSAADELLPRFPGIQLEPIRVSPRGGPIVLHRRLPDGAIAMRLNTADTYWAQYAFQFSHELCHILCRYNETPHANKWFEESICELASLFVLRRMAQTWETRPPYPNWKSFAPRLTAYAQDLIDKASLPEGQTLAQWYRRNADALRANSTDRPRNTIVAAALLPLFEAEPQHWAAIWRLNDAAYTPTQPLAGYLQAWHDRVADEHRPFIRRLASEFAVTLQAP
jgi:hypothetical protein